MAGHKGGTPPIRSKAQQGYVFGVLAKRDPSATTWGKRWSRGAGETGGGTPPSRAAYAALPARKGLGPATVRKATVKRKASKKKR